MKILLALIVLLSTTSLFAQAVVRHGFTEKENEEMARHNEMYSFFEKYSPSLIANLQDPQSLDLITQTQATAYAEFNEAGYLIFSDQFDFNSRTAKLEMARNLPPNMTLIVYTQSKSAAKVQEIKDLFSTVIAPERFKVVFMPQSGRGFWARDGVPVPVVRESLQSDEQFFTLVDARYYHSFEPDKEFSQLFASQLTRHNYYFEGGNFIVNSKNECLIVNNSRTKQIPDQIFKDHYGCQKLLRLPHVKGIGHADESVKFMDDENVITDEVSYVQSLENQGYRVTLLPRPKRSYETYVNALTTNGLVFVPVFNQSTDDEVLKVYESFGLKAIGLNSVSLSNDGLGSIHCITMTYPPQPLSELMKNIGAQPL